MIEMLKALGGSLLGRDLSYYPRRADGAGKIESKAMLDTIRTSLDEFAFDPTDVSKASDPKLLLDRAKDSLEEAKKQTEYQDAKAGRLLTIVAFLTAAVGTVFGKFIDIYPLRDGHASLSQTSAWVLGTYALFGVYLLLVAAGALVTFHAMSTRFVWPPGGSNLADKDEIVSLLFYQQIIRTKPESWGKVFAGDKGELLRTYYKNYVAEAYLVATKVADKLRYLDPGQRLLSASIRVLLALFAMIVITFTQVPPPPKPAAVPQASGTAASTQLLPAGGSHGAVPPLPEKAPSATQQSGATTSPAATVASAATSKTNAQESGK